MKVNEHLLTLLREGRKAFQQCAEPIDWVSRLLNNKKGYPPLWIRQKVGNLNDFEGSGGEYAAYLKLLCGLESGDDLLDIGCGCGLMCLGVNENTPIPQYVYPGSYVGMDTDWTLIDWCVRYIKPKHKNCFFSHLTGKAVSPLPAASSSFNAILAKSLFTHLLLDETKNYLKETERLLKPNGRCLATFFLVRDDMKLEGRYRFRYPSVNGHVYYERYTNPKLAVAYDEELLISLIERFGLEVKEIKYGTWSGRQDGLSFQDIIIMRRLKDEKD